MDKFIPYQHPVSPSDLKAANLPYILPTILRVQSIVRLPAPGGLMLNRATLYHDKAYFSTEWVTRHADVRIRRGSLVSVVWAERKPVATAPFRVDRLVLVERPRPEVNLFETVPPTTVKDRQLLKRAAKLWESLPRGMRHLFNAMFWEGDRFLKYLMGPPSLEIDGCVPSGNFRHCVEVAEQALAMARSHGKAQAPIVVIAGVLHDAGKAEEFRFDRVHRCFELSETGRLISHRDRLQHWIAAAMATHRIIMPETHLTGLLHALTATQGVPKWLGLQPARTLEASILLMADRFAQYGECEYTVANQPEYEQREYQAGHGME